MNYITTGQDLGFLKNLTSYNINESVRAKLESAQKAGFDISSQDNETIYKNTASLDQSVILDIASALKNGSFNGQYISIKDQLNGLEYPQLFNAAVELFMASVPPVANNITQTLFPTIKYTGKSYTITIRSIGGVTVEEVAPGAAYPETSPAISDQSFRTSIEIKKVGAKLAAPKEFLEADGWGIYAYCLMQLKQAIDMYKEKQAFNLLNEMAGFTIKDNATPANAELGSFTGRGIDGNFNGAISVDDLFEMMAWHNARGYNPDTFIIHPFTWMMWQRDRDTRDVLLGSLKVVGPNISPAAGWGSPIPGGLPYGTFGAGVPNSSGSTQPLDPVFGKLGISPYGFPNITPWGMTIQGESRYVSGTFKIIVSPFVPCYKITGNSNSALNGKYASNIILADSTRCGIIFEKEAPTLEDWQDIEKETEYVKVRTRYGMNVLEQGRGVLVARNAVLDRTYTFDNVNSVQLSPIDTTTARI
jgi:hypothetical protein